MPSASISLPLNFFVFPLGYLYVKDSKRFLLGTIYLFVQPTFVSLIAWLNPRYFPVSANAPILFTLGFLILLFVLIDTYRLTRRGGGPSTWPVFAKPHAFWFIPVYLIAFGILSILMEPWEKPFARTHTIPSPSMEPNVQLGDLIFVDYMIDTDHVKRTDIVTHRGTGMNAGKSLIKRIVAGPGDRIQFFRQFLAGTDKRVYPVIRYKLNGKPVPLTPVTGSYKLPPTLGHEGLFREGFPEAQYDILEGEIDSPISEELAAGITLGPNEFFLLGDNRDHAADSRFTGVVERRDIIGKYLHTYFSFYIPNPSCEFGPPLLFTYRALTHGKHQPCGSVSIRWDKAGYVAR